jgi:DNA-binding CsgD family transcriptional regulator
MIVNGKAVQELMDYFRIRHESRKKEIVDSLAAFEEIPHSFCAVCNFQSNRFIYLSKNVETVLGFPHADFLHGGYEFLFGLIPPTVIPKILARQMEYNKMFSSPEFDYTRPCLIEFEGKFHTNEKELLVMKQHVIILEFEPGASVRVFFALWQTIEAGSKQTIRKTEIQRRLKAFQHLLFGPASEENQRSNTKALIKMKTPDFIAPKLTEKEKELLLMLSRGLSLKETAKKMKVSYFTSESHRKHLFDKFEVRNVAELIKKASKVYWLE